MAAVRWNPKSFTLALAFFVLLLTLLPEARYDSRLYLSLQVRLGSIFPSVFFRPALNISFPLDSCLFPAKLFCIIPVLNQFSQPQQAW